MKIGYLLAWREYYRRWRGPRERESEKIKRKEREGIRE